MGCDCDKLAYGAALLGPLECKKILGPFLEDFVLTDVLFELYSYPNGASSRGCGTVHNVMPGAWSRQFFGGNVEERGREYHLESGILCPRNSYLDVCNCLFGEGPTAWVSARVTGCYCTTPSRFARPAGLLSPHREWSDLQGKEEIDPVDPTGTGGKKPLPVHRELVAMGHEAVGPGEWGVLADRRAISVRPGTSAALRVRRGAWTWSAARKRVRAPKLPARAGLVVARRSADGLLVHWSAYREERQG